MCDQLTRRGFLVGCSGAIAALAGPRFNTVAFADPNGVHEILVVIFLRGGMDGMSLVFPTSGADRGHLQTLRPSLIVPTSGPNAAIQIPNAPFGFHPALAPLYPIYQDGHLAVVRACGLPQVNRSHFDAMQYVELGTPGSKSSVTGWLTRHLATAPNLPAQVIMPSLAVGDLQPTSLAGSLETINLVDPGSFSIDNGPWLWRSAQRTALRRLYNADNTWNHQAGLQALDAVDIVELNVNGPYVPGNGADYPDSSFAEHLQVLAQMIKLDLGLAVATVDYGGWDTHEGQGTGGTGYLAQLLGDLCGSLAAFYTDLNGAGGGNYTSRLTVVVQSEFGREVRENSDDGTEHGYGNTMLVLSGNAIGGLHGQWPGLNPAGQLFEGTDLAVTTDYRRVLSEVLIRRCANPDLRAIFPGYSGYAPLGVVNGADLPPIQEGDFGRATFEAGNLSEWSSSTGG